MFTPTPKQLDALARVNVYMPQYGLSPLSEAEIRDWNITGDETEADCEQIARDIADEEHVSRCDNKFWAEHDWQNDF
jgi:hypothetical protein